MLALWGALAGMGLEFFGIFEDNLTIPIGAALTMLLLGNAITVKL
jgi:dolichol kinase